MPEPTNNYADIRQIVQDAVLPLKEQLDRIYESLNREFYRKDALDPQIKSLQDDIEELKQAHKDIKAQVMGTPQRLLLIVGSILGLITALVNIFQHIKLF